MDKEKIIKWSKRGVISTVLLMGIWGLILLTYYKIYEPYKWKLQEDEMIALYNEGINHPEKATFIAKEERLESEKVIQILDNAAEKGYIDAQIMLANELEPENPEKSSYWYLQAAQNENSEAQYKIGVNYKYGRGVKQSFVKAFKWLKESAEKGNPYAQYELGNIYLYGLAFYDSYPYCFKGPHSSDYDYTHLIYEGNNLFISKDLRTYYAKDIYLEEILKQPYDIYLYPDIKKAKYYWKLAAKQGLQEAKDALEKVYD